MISTIVERYGVRNVFESDIIKQQISETTRTMALPGQNNKRGQISRVEL